MPRPALASTALAWGLAAALLNAHAALACDTCVAPAATLATPTVACQSVAGQTDAACPSDVFRIDLVAGNTYVFTLCDTTCAGAFADYDSRLRILDPACVVQSDVDDWCGLASEVTYTASATGPHAVEVTGYTTASFGNYRLGWHRVCLTTDCATPAATLPTPNTRCRTVADTLDCADTMSFAVPLVQGQTYAFSLCPATCPQAFADFDSRVELRDEGGAVVGSSDGACGDDGEVTHATDPLSGGGTYCVTVIRQAGSGDFSLAYRVACQAPSDLTLSPLVIGAVAPDCAVSPRFTATVAGTGPFTWDWSIVPSPGDTATPASGSATGETNSLQVSTRLSGSGTYRLRVTVTNDCGTLTQDVDVVVEDRRAPDLDLQAQVVDCNPGIMGVASPRMAPRAGATPQAAAAPTHRPVVQQPAVAPPSAAALEALATKGDTLAPGLPSLDGRAPGFQPLPVPMDLGCATPCDLGSLQASQDFYDVFLDCDMGAFTARTGARHPVTTASGVSQNVIFGGQAGVPGTSDITFRVHETATSYLDPFGGRTCAFDPPDTTAEPASLGLEQEWSVSPMPDVELTLRQEIVAFGTTESDSGIRLTLGATNAASSAQAVTMGVRWQIDYQNSWDDGPFLATVACNPLELRMTLETEHELLDSEIEDFYRIQNNTGDPIFSNFTSTAPLAGFPDTVKPDRLVYGYWPWLTASDWSYVADEGTAGVDLDSAVLYYVGYEPADGIVLAPGASFTRSVVIFTSGETVDCGGFVPGNGGDRIIEACEGDCVDLGAVATDACGSSTVALTSATPGAPPCAGNPCSIEVDAAATHAYTFTATDEAGNTTTAVLTVEVRSAAECAAPGCDPPLLGPVRARDLADCNLGIEVTWDPATFRDASRSGVYNVYRSETSCDDALARGPIATGLTGLLYLDTTTQAWAAYVYVVEAEDGSTDGACPPPGPHHGGSVARACTSMVIDVGDIVYPDGVYAVLRARHQGDEVTFTWTAARPLLADEHLHLTKAHEQANATFARVNPEADVTRSHAETDTSSWLQFFDLRVANGCEVESLPEYPPGR
jgi:hypothetical protein